MLFYEYSLKCMMKADKKLVKSVKKNKERQNLQNTFIRVLNKKLEENKAALGLEHLGCYECKYLGLGENKELEFTFQLVVGKKPNHKTTAEFNKQLADLLAHTFPVTRIMLHGEETVPNYLNNKQFEQVAKSGRDFLLSLGLPDSTMGEFQLCEDKLKVDQDMNLEAALERAEELFLDDSFKEELKRIFSEENAKEFVTHPVHYYLEVDNEEKLTPAVRLLTESLYANKRLPSLRLDEFGNFDENIAFMDNLSSFVAMTEGSTIVLRTNGTREEGHEELIEAFRRYIGRMAKNTLYIVAAVKGQCCFGKKLVKALEKQINFVELGTMQTIAKPLSELLEKMAEKSGLGELYQNKPPAVVEREEGYSSEEVQEIFNTWAEATSRELVYKAYAGQSFTQEEKTELKSSMQELEQLIGLKDAKETARALLATAKVNKLRKEQGLVCQGHALHMLFTGNPGSAKTTFARLITKILAENGIIASSRLVECGRADLVGKYVGWTAQCVKEKFTAAKGGVLFIDEAYSLIGEGNDYGAEAISTIVQEMENHREDVVVIFAGYPDKMEAFLKQNEGLRSRIPYHMQFPDYTEAELVEIMKLMVAERGYELTEGFEAKCRQQVHEAVKQKDFGNGRYVRNLLEKAIDRQSLRIAEGYAENRITKSLLLKLEAEDFPLMKVPKAVKMPPMGLAL